MRQIATRLCTAAAVLALAGLAHAQTLITFESTASGGSLPGVPVDGNITGGTLSRGSGLINNTGGTYNSAGFTVGADLAGAIANNDYLSFTVDVTSGAQASVNQIQVRYDRSNTGPSTVVLLSSVTGFTTSATPIFVDSSVNANGEANDIPVSGHDNLAGTIEFRIYGVGATNASGTFDFEVYPGGTGAGIAIIINGSTMGGGGTTGACCAAGGSCSTVTQANCTGTYLGDNTSCSPNPCPQPTGACCVNSFCVGDLTESACLANGTGSVWGGLATTCATFTCPQPTGSCCVGPVCTANVTAAQCSGVFTVAGTCSPDLCDDGACCNAVTGACRVTFTEADCTTLGGTFTLQGTCTPNPCPVPQGACCTAGVCTLTSDGLLCRSGGGAFLGGGTVCVPTPCDRATGANLVAKYDFDVNVVGGGSRNLTFTNSVNPPFPTGDQFGVAQRYVDANLPFGLLDDTGFTFPTDAQGIIREDKVDSWFGAVDLFDVISPTGTASATWTFDITGFTNLSISLDIAAMGDFETAAGCSQPPCLDDRYEFTVSIDGGTPVAVFTAIADEAGSLSYTMASGAVVGPINDPLVIGSTALTNVFQNLSANITGTGATLTLTFTGSGDGGDEAIAFDNIMIMGESQGGGQTGACCAGTTCTITDAAGCTSVFNFFAGVNTACNLPNNATTPCCKADYNQSGAVTVQDIFDFLGGYFIADPNADINGGGTSVQDIFDYLAAYFAGCN